MATNPTITLGNLTLEYIDDPVPDSGVPGRDLGSSSNPLSDQPAQTTDATKERQQQYTVRIVGVASQSESAADNKVRQIHNLALEVMKDSNTLVDTGANRSVSVTYQVLKNPPFPLPRDYLYEYGDEARIPLTLNVRPWAVGTPVTATLASNVATPSLVSATILGEVPTPLTLTLTRGFTGSGMNGARIAVVPASTSLSDLMFFAKDASGSWWDLATASSAYTSGSNNVRDLHDSETWRKLTWNRALPASANGYLLVGRARVDSGDTGYLAQCRLADSPAVPSAPPVKIKADNLALFDLGHYFSDGYSPFRICGKATTAANRLRLDWILAIPLGLWSPWAFTSNVHTAVYVTQGPDDCLMYTAAGLQSARRYVSGPAVKAVGAVKLLVIAQDSAGSPRQPTATLAATYTPRYLHWIPNA
jgi:hypothetical protein